MAERSPAGELPGFTRRVARIDGRARNVFRVGERGPGVVVMSEMPGITPRVARFAVELAGRGFRVDVPDLFGRAGRPMTAGELLRSWAEVCVSREFVLLERGRSSPVTAWLRGLARELHRECGGPGVGAVGMCLTGNFALALMLDPCLLAPVLSQPSLPLLAAEELHLADGELAEARRRSREEGVEILALRFTHDRLCPAARFRRLRAEFGERLESVEIDSGPGNQHGLSQLAHSVLAHDFVDEEGHPTRDAFERVVAFLSRRLGEAA